MLLFIFFDSVDIFVILLNQAYRFWYKSTGKKRSKQAKLIGAADVQTSYYRRIRVTKRLIGYL
jgi:hypothetical protein